MNYITSKELSEKWGISQRRIVRLALDGRINGAKLYGNSWMFPENASRPADGRTRKGRMQETDTFRFPSFEYRDSASFNPPLNEEELRMKAMEEAFYACRFEEADEILGDLPEITTDRYHRIRALYEGCMIDTFLCNRERFFERCSRLTAELQEDFPHKKEMESHLYELGAALGANDYYLNWHKVGAGYAYHESFLPHLAALNTVYLSLPESKITTADLNHGELTCRFLENSGAYADLQNVHLYLASAYVMLGMKDAVSVHFKRALSIAMEHSLFFLVAAQYYYLKKLLKPVLSEFSGEIVAKLEALSDDIHSRYVRFMEALPMNSVYRMLETRDYAYLYYAVQGLTNKEIAGRLHTSVGAVGKRYGEIYAVLGVASKREMIELYKSSVECLRLGR